MTGATTAQMTIRVTRNDQQHKPYANAEPERIDTSQRPEHRLDAAQQVADRVIAPTVLHVMNQLHDHALVEDAHSAEKDQKDQAGGSGKQEEHDELKGVQDERGADQHPRLIEVDRPDPRHDRPGSDSLHAHEG